MTNKCTINGYMIEDIQQRMLSILIEVDRICRKHHIQYVLDSGTLLGAVRHQGFIPWDDDIDIAMLRADYERFCKVVQQELPEPYVFEEMSSRKEYPNIFGKCYDTSTRYVQKNTQHLNCQQGIFLDIFPVDNVKMKSKYIQSRLVASINTVRCIKLRTEPLALRHMLYAPLFVLPIRFLNKLADSVMKYYAKRETEIVSPICQSGTSKPNFKRTMFTDRVTTNFCGIQFPIPRDYMGYLEGYYANPMELPPEEKRRPSHGIVEIKL